MLPPGIRRRIFIIFAFLFFAYLFHQAVLALGNSSSQSLEWVSDRLAFILFLFAFPLVTAWTAVNAWTAIGLSVPVLFLNALAYTVVKKPGFLLFFLFYGLLYVLLDRFDRFKNQRILLQNVQLERNENEKNELETQMAELSQDLESSLQKYSKYYGLREVAEHFATTLALEELAKLMMGELRSFIPRGEGYLIYLAEVDKMSLSLISSHSTRETRIKTKTGDLFDHWVLKNRQPLLVEDTLKDVRFDSRQAKEEMIRSLVIAPLIDEGKVIGICRVYSGQANDFSTEDLRILDAIAVLASPAIANALLYQKTEELAIRDSLTGLFVQRYFKQRLKDEHRRALLRHEHLSLLMCDLDFFKKYNDTFGHAAGDMVLAEFAKIISANVPEDAIVARYGGEEFALLLPDMNKAQAIEVAKTICQKTAEFPFTLRREPTQMTVSIGVGTLPDDALEAEELLRIADEKLYRAKREGRNRVIPAAASNTGM